MKGNVVVLKIIGVLDIYDAAEFNEAVAKYLEKTCNFVFDLGECTSFGDDGLALLVSFLKKVSDRGGDVRFANLSERTRMILEITRAWKIFDIFDDVETAVRSYNAD